MKRFLLLMLAAMMCLLPFAVLSEAESEELCIEACGLKIYLTPPLETILLERESSASVFNRAGLFQPQTVAYMEEWDIYALLVSETDDAWEISVSIGESDEADMETMTEFSVAMLCAWMERDYTEAGYTGVKAEFFSSLGHPYVRLEASYTLEDGYQGSIVTYYTTQSGHWVDVTLQSDGAAPGEDALLIVEELVHSVWCMPKA